MPAYITPFTFTLLKFELPTRFSETYGPKNQCTCIMKKLQKIYVRSLATTPESKSIPCEGLAAKELASSWPFSPLFELTIFPPISEAVHPYEPIKWPAYHYFLVTEENEDEF